MAASTAFVEHDTPEPEQERKPNRRERRATPPARTVRESRFASLRWELAHAGKVFPLPGEPLHHFHVRVVRAAAVVQHNARRAKRRAVKAARRHNRKAK